ncbi:MAG TPA: esterase-like activity of phytase family protein [Polyangiaceae bacterium]|nr:esterase-like activity of phytase family protein [Polyangiaceae bacterium]
MRTSALVPLALATLAALVLSGLGCTRTSGEPNGAASASQKKPPPPLELTLERALPIAVAGDFEPSGLLLFEQHLLTVSDKHDDTVFELVTGAETAQIKEFIRFAPPAEEPRPFDFEGLAATPGGSLLLASEARYRVLAVTKAGVASWFTHSVQALGLESGLFRKRNAGLEGITFAPGGRLLLAAEREPRGLIEFDTPPGSSRARAWAMPESAYPPPGGREPDFSDLTTFEKRVYALERNSHLIVCLEPTPGRWLEREAWSYAKTENDPRFLYENSSFGLAEGLAIDETHVFLVLDNNREARAAAPSDHRPLLFIFRRPH